MTWKNQIQTRFWSLVWPLEELRFPTLNISRPLLSQRFWKWRVRLPCGFMFEFTFRFTFPNNYRVTFPAVSERLYPVFPCRWTFLTWLNCCWCDYYLISHSCREPENISNILFLCTLASWPRVSVIWGHVQECVWQEKITSVIKWNNEMTNRCRD